MKKFLFLCGRLGLGGIFVYASLQKIVDPSAFATDIGHFRLLPHPLVLLGALYLPWIEFVTGLALLGRWRERGALLVIALLCGIFFAALVSAWARGLDINCGCFGHSATASDLPLAVGRSVALGALAIILFRHSRPAVTTAP